jgi:hypothetical protein
MIRAFLAQSDKLLERNKVESPFGNGPWPCLNSICPSYRQKVIQAAAVQYKYGYPVGTFNCPTCGYTYIRRGPDRSTDSDRRKPKIIDIGHLWKRRLSEVLPIPHRRLRTTARELGVDPKTILRYADIFANENRGELSQTNLDAISAADRRKKWLELMDSHPDFRVKALRQLSQATYKWLYRYNRAWLEEHKPKPLKRTNSAMRVDWRARDHEMSVQIPIAAEKIRLRPGRPIQVTRASIGRELGILPLLEKHIDKLPLCQGVLDKEVEDRVQYAVRRVQRVLEDSRAQGISLVRWQIVRRAGIGRMVGWDELENVLKEV